MKIRFSDLWRWDGTIDRGPYAIIGLLGFAIKHNLDRIIATVVFHRKWNFFNYWIPLGQAVRITSLSHQDSVFLATMLVLALPFIWVGVVLTLRRLRSAGLPLWQVAFFFLPLVNLVFFLVLSILPSGQESVALPARRGTPFQAIMDRIVPGDALGSAALAVLVTALFGVSATGLSVSFFGMYGWSLFIALPFCLGLFSVLIYGYHRPRSYGSCLLVSLLSIAIVAGALLALAFEGIFCLVMAAPLAILLGMLGGAIGYFIQRRAWNSTEAPATLAVVLLCVPALMTVEHAAPGETPLLEVRTRLEINASPETVWRKLVAFPPLPAPDEWAFRLGIAYPVQSTLHGQGAGAQRECLFSSGTFVEPIESWEEGRRLKFYISAQPPIMREWSPYKEIHTVHLEGRYFQSEGAEFVLIPLPGGRMRLEGISSYRNRMWPMAYWRLWSDAIVHNIHLRVFHHIKRLAEQHEALASRR
jgi:hypothetical protein